jgi:hypothetical protein
MRKSPHGDGSDLESQFGMDYSSTIHPTSLTDDSEDEEPMVTRRPLQALNVNRDRGLWEESQHATPHSQVRQAACLNYEGPSTENAFGRSGDIGTPYNRGDGAGKASGFFLGVPTRPRLPLGEFPFDDQ